MNTKKYSHVPALPCSATRYRTLYESVLNVTTPYDFKYQRIAIPKSCTTEAEVYSLLPRGLVEYSGYISEKYIFSTKGKATISCADYSKECVWHSHPMKSVFFDMPSQGDIYHLLKWQNIRSVVVGREFTWVLEKQRATIPIIQKLFSWEDKYPLYAMKTDAKKMFPDQLAGKYMPKVLKGIAGSSFPTNFGLKKDPEAWIAWAHDKLGIRVRKIQNKK